MRTSALHSTTKYSRNWQNPFTKHEKNYSYDLFNFEQITSLTRFLWQLRREHLLDKQCMKPDEAPVSGVSRGGQGGRGGWGSAPRPPLTLDPRPPSRTGSGAEPHRAVWGRSPQRGLGRTPQLHFCGGAAPGVGAEPQPPRPPAPPPPPPLPPPTGRGRLWVEKGRSDG